MNWTAIVNTFGIELSSIGMESKDGRTMKSAAPQRTRRIKKDEIRSRLFQSALRLFSAKGFDRTTLEEIAEEAGFSKGAVYSNFEGKDELFFCLIEDQIDARIEAMEGIRVVDGDPAEAARKRMELLFELVSSDPGWQILFIEYWLRAVRNPALLRRFVERRRLMRDKIARHLERDAAMLPDEARLSPSGYALLLLALSNGLGIERIIDPETVTQDFAKRLLSVVH